MDKKSKKITDLNGSQFMWPMMVAELCIKGSGSAQLQLSSVQLPPPPPVAILLHVMTML